MPLKQPRFKYSAVGHLLKTKKEYKNVNKRFQIYLSKHTYI